MSRVEKALAYVMACLPHNQGYRLWREGEDTRQPGFWGGTGYPPNPKDVHYTFCASVPNLAGRAVGVDPPRNGGIYNGGTRSYMLAFKGAVVPFKLSEFRRGDLAFRDFQYAGAWDQGHIGIALGGPDDKFLQSFPFQQIQDGLSDHYTLRQSHDNGYYQWRIPHEVWLGKDETPGPGRTLSETIDDYFVSRYQQYGPYQPVGKVIVEEAEGNIDVALAAALVEKESGGRNIFGCDWGPRWTTVPPYCNVAVTRERVQALIKNFEAGGGQNGVGLTQLTSRAYVYAAEERGGAHIPRYQCRVGFRLMSDLIQRLGYDDALAAYNAGEGNLTAGRAYARDLAIKHGVWKSRLTGLTEPQKPEQELGYAVTIGSPEKPLKKKHAENIAKAHRKHGRDAKVGEVGMTRGNRIPYDEWVAMTAPNDPPEPQNQPVEVDSPGPSNRTPEEQETALRPTRKISAVAAAGAVTTIVLYVLNMYGVEPPPELGAAVATVVALVLGYLTPEGS